MADEDASDDTASDGTAANREYEDWPFEGDRPDDAQYVGTAQAGGNAWFYSEGSDRLFASEADEGDQRLLPASDEQTVREGESLGEAVERLGDELGWESLSTFARKHLERDG
jgi:hypothetical protein